MFCGKRYGQAVPAVNRQSRLVGQELCPPVTAHKKAAPEGAASLTGRKSARAKEESARTRPTMAQNG